MFAQKKIALLSKSDFSFLTYAAIFSGGVKERSVPEPTGRLRDSLKSLRHSRFDGFAVAPYGLPEPPLVPPIPPLHLFFQRRRELRNAILSYIAKQQCWLKKKIALLSKSDFSFLTYATLISGAMKERSVNSGLPEPPLVPPLPPQHLFFQRRRDLPKANLSYIAKQQCWLTRKNRPSYEERFFHSLPTLRY